jgi:hypothetical protein
MCKIFQHCFQKKKIRSAATRGHYGQKIFSPTESTAAVNSVHPSLIDGPMDRPIDRPMGRPMDRPMGRLMGRPKKPVKSSNFFMKQKNSKRNEGKN